MAESAFTTPKLFLYKELLVSRRLLIFGIFLLLIVFVWHSYLTVKVHKEYQASLMESVSLQVVREYQSHIDSLRQDIRHFAWVYQNELNELVAQGPSSKTEEYLNLLEQLRLDIPDVRLFSVIDEKGHGVFKHITGDFLQDCKEEINSTLEHQSQEHLFLHRSATSIHYDLLEPLEGSENYIFVAFKPTKLIELLSDYRLPQQELFLLRQDLVGKVELSSVKALQEQVVTNLQMSELEVAEFSVVTPIPDTRWQVAVRLDKEYSDELLFDTYSRSLLIWLAITVVLLVSYFSKRQRLISQYKMMKKIQFNESHDSLTGLMNRASFVRQLDESVSLLEPKTGGAFLVDIDRFQVFNNALGFGKGDETLKLATELIKEIAPSKSLVSRISNDQFAVFSPLIEHADVPKFAERLRKEIANLDLSRVEAQFSLTASIGVIELDNSFIDGDHVMNALMLSIKLAKEKGRNRVQQYQSADPALIKHANEMEVFKAVRGALTESKFEIYRQRLVPSLHQNNESEQPSTQSDTFEVLLRMTDSEGKMVSPGLFIPVAEEHSLAVEIDKWVITQTFKYINSENSKDNYCINLSGLSLADESMADFVKSALEAKAINPAQITLEITETYAITHLEAAISFIGELTKLGCQFALDDFGSGLSSFSYLQKLPVQKLKIDGVFIRDIANSPRNQTFVKTMVELAKSMDMQTVAEFVETKEEHEILMNLGIDYCQGYYFHKPEPWH